MNILSSLFSGPQAAQPQNAVTGASMPWTQPQGYLTRLGAAIADPQVGFHKFMSNEQQRKTGLMAQNASADFLKNEGFGDNVIEAAKRDPRVMQMAIKEAFQRRASAKAEAPKHNIKPTWVRNNKTNNYELLRMDNAGGMAVQALPDGYQLDPKVNFLNTGTEFVGRDQYGNEVGAGARINNRQKAAETAQGQTEGKSLGQAKDEYQNMLSKLPGLEVVVGELEKLSDEATYTYAGQARDFAARQLGLGATDGALARTDYIAKVDNQVLPLLRQTFGAAFTVKEGETLRATLGDPNKSPEEKKRVLRAFIEQKKRDVEAAAMRISGDFNSQQSSPVPGQTNLPDPGQMTDEQIRRELQELGQ